MFKYYDESGQLIANSSISDVPGATIKLIDESSELEIYQPHSFKNTKITVGKNCKVVIKKNASVKESMTLLTKKSNNVFIGENFNVRSIDLICRSEPKTFIKIGDNFLGSSQIVFRASDAHTVFDKTSKRALNIPKFGITVGDHVWMGQRVTLLKDVTIPNNCVVSFGALVTSKPFLENSVIAGIPARVVKTNINWSEYNTFNYTKLHPNTGPLINEESSDPFSQALSLYRMKRYDAALTSFLNIKRSGKVHLKEIDRCIALTFLRLKKFHLAKSFFERALQEEAFTNSLSIAGSVYCNIKCSRNCDFSAFNEILSIVDKKVFNESLLILYNFFQKESPELLAKVGDFCCTKNYPIKKQIGDSSPDECRVVVKPFVVNDSVEFDLNKSCDQIFVSVPSENQYFSFIENVIDNLIKELQDYKKITVVSSSLGAHFACLLAYKLSSQKPVINVEVMALSPISNLTSLINSPKIKKNSSKYDFIERSVQRYSNLKTLFSSYDSTFFENFKIRVFYCKQNIKETEQALNLDGFKFIELVPYGENEDNKKTIHD